MKLRSCFDGVSSLFSFFSRFLDGAYSPRRSLRNPHFPDFPFTMISEYGAKEVGLPFCTLMICYRSTLAALQLVPLGSHLLHERVHAAVHEMVEIAVCPHQGDFFPRPFCFSPHRFPFGIPSNPGVFASSHHPNWKKGGNKFAAP